MGALVVLIRIGVISIISSLLSLLINAIPIMIPGLVLGIVPAVCGIIKKKYGLGVAGFLTCFVGPSLLGCISSVVVSLAITFLFSFNYVPFAGMVISAVLGGIIATIISTIAAILICVIVTLLIFLTPKKSKRVAVADQSASKQIPDDAEKKDAAFDMAKELSAYKSMLDDGLITQEDFDAKKKELLKL